MEKFYRITNKKFLDEINNYRRVSKEQQEFVIQFCKENNIDCDQYYMGGSGFCNTAFEEYNRKNITLAVIDTDNNMSRYEKDFKKDRACDILCEFKKSSKILKKFQDECIEKRIIINLLRIRVGDYFKELHLGGFSTNGLDEKDGVYYLKISTSKHDSITPEDEGFDEIKGSEYYSIIENIEQEGEN